MTDSTIDPSGTTPPRPHRPIAAARPRGTFDARTIAWSSTTSAADDWHGVDDLVRATGRPRGPSRRRTPRSSASIPDCCASAPLAAAAVLMIPVALAAARRRRRRAARRRTATVASTARRRSPAAPRRRRCRSRPAADRPVHAPRPSERASDDVEVAAAVQAVAEPEASVRRHLHRRLQRLLEPLRRSVGRHRRGVAGSQRRDSRHAAVRRRRALHPRGRHGSGTRRRRRPPPADDGPPHAPQTTSATPPTAAPTSAPAPAVDDGSTDGPGHQPSTHGPAAAVPARGRGHHPRDLARRPRGAGRLPSPSVRAACGRA